MRVPCRSGTASTHGSSDLGRVVVGEDHDRVRAPCRVGEDELFDDHREATRATENHQVAGLDDHAASATHAVDPVLDAGGDDADERAGDQHAEQRDEQRQDPSTPADVTGHGAGVEDPQQALPGVLEPTGSRRSGEGDAEDGQEQRAHQDGGECDDSEPGERRARAPGQHVVEPVADPLADGHVDRACRPDRPCVATSAASTFAGWTGGSST